MKPQASATPVETDSAAGPKGGRNPRSTASSMPRSGRANGPRVGVGGGDQRASALPRAPLARAVRRGYSALMKHIFRATHPADERHSEKLWPHVRIQRDRQGRIESFGIGHRTINIANASLTSELDRHGRQANAIRPGHLIACGPSIATIDYTALSLSGAMGVNGAIALAANMPVKFDYYCVTDTGFLRKRPELVAEIVSRDLLFFTTPLGLWHILQYFPEERLACRFFLIERVGVPALRRPVSAAEAVANSAGDLALFNASLGLGYSHDIRKGIFPGGTVAYEGVQLLAWLGFKDIYLHGLDLGNAASQPRFYETAENKLPTTLHKQLAGEIEPSFRSAAAILRERDITVRNLSPVSALGEDIFPKCHWRSLLDEAR